MKLEEFVDQMDLLVDFMPLEKFVVVSMVKID